jgi:cupin fold WbuC family metalloprotein
MLATLVDEARAAPRRRKNLNFHQHAGAAAQRLLNAIEPDSYVRPHRHLDPAKDETFVALAGRVGVILFDATGSPVEWHVVEPGGLACGITIPAGVFHTVLALTTGAVVFEAKAGPYRGNDDNEFAAFAPAEGEPACAAVLAAWRTEFEQRLLVSPDAAGR